MTCAKCQHVESNAWSMGQHWKTAHPAEFKKRQAAKKAKRAAQPVEPEADEVAPDFEQQLISDCVFEFKLAVERGIGAQGCGRVLEYLRDRFVSAPAVIEYPLPVRNGVAQRVGIS